MKSVCIVLILAVLYSVQASHFRFGTLTYTIPDVSQPNAIQLTLQCIFRRSYFPQALTVGGPLLMNIDMNELNYGDGTTQPTLPGTVQSLDPTTDAVTASYTVLHTYNVTVNTIFTVVFDSRARLSTLNNNHDERYEVSADVTVIVTGTPNSSPISGALPIQPATVNTTNTFTILASGNSDLTFGLSPATIQGDPTATQPPAFTIDATTGVVTWKTYGLALGLWNAQIQIFDQLGAYIVLDFLLNLVPPTVHAVPYFTPVSPAPGASLEYPAGVAINLIIGAASNQSSDNITISYSNLPNGVTIGNGVGTNPTNRSLSWFPSADEAGNTYTFIFLATNGFASTTLSFQITIDPYPTPIPTASPSAAPTGMPTDMPSAPPTGMPTDMPTASPSASPTGMPTASPTTGPFCGDQICQTAEYCSNCPQDCGTCPMVIYSRGTPGYVVYATQFNGTATVAIQPYNNNTAPTLLQSWKYDSVNNRIVSRYSSNYIIGAGPTAQKQPASENSITWDFKANYGAIQYYGSAIHEFLQIPVGDGSGYVYFQDKQLNGGANGFAAASCLVAPYNKPTNPALKEVWGPRCVAGSVYQQFMFWTYPYCKNCPESGPGQP